MTDKENLQNIRHSLAHLLAASVRELFPGAKNAIGPAIDDGFYQDFDLPQPVSEKDLPKIEKKMRELLKRWDTFERKEVSASEAKKEFAWNEYKSELIEEFSKDGKPITFYVSGGFVDLCRGGHVESAREIKPDAFKLDRLAGAYWRGSEKNKMLTRIYGLAFASKKELDDYVAMREEAKKRDHKVLGPKLDLFMFHETAPGMPYWLPKGVAIYNELVNFWRAEHSKRGYQEIVSPLLNKKELYVTSGHYEHYWGDMFKIRTEEGEEYGVKAMNCPNAHVVYGSRAHSYRELPLRLSDTDALHRNELSGTLNGLLRVREFRQDDAHIYVTEEQIESEYEEVFKIVELFYSVFGMRYSYRLGTRPKEFMGDIETWNHAEDTLKHILERSGKDYVIKEGDGAFYGPKVDILMKDVLGRDWQMGTIQLDFQQPRRFKLEYTAADGSKKTPIAIHRVIYGSLERFIGILIEHYAGAFPLWLAPVQVAVLPISDKFADYGQTVLTELKTAGIRAELDLRPESIGKKIREAAMQKVPYQIIVGEKEVAVKKIAVRARDGKDLGQLELKNFLQQLGEEIKEKK